MPRFPGRFRFPRTGRRTGSDPNSAPSAPYMTGNTAQSPGNAASGPLTSLLQAPPIVVLYGEPSALQVTASLVAAALWMAGVYLNSRRTRA